MLGAHHIGAMLCINVHRVAFHDMNQELEPVDMDGDMMSTWMAESIVSGFRWILAGENANVHDYMQFGMYVYGGLAGLERAKRRRRA